MVELQAFAAQQLIDSFATVLCRSLGQLFLQQIITDALRDVQDPKGARI